MLLLFLRNDALNDDGVQMECVKCRVFFIFAGTHRHSFFCQIERFFLHRDIGGGTARR